MAKRVGTIHFWLDDDRENIYNMSTDVSYALYVDETEIEDDIIEIDRLVDYCIGFANAIGFPESVVLQAFGRE